MKEEKEKDLISPEHWANLEESKSLSKELEENFDDMTDAQKLELFERLDKMHKVKMKDAKDIVDQFEKELDDNQHS